MHPEIALLAVEAIDQADDKYRISDPGGEHRLVESIGQAGLISLPVVQEKKGGGCYRPVAGFKRIAALRLLGWYRVACRIVPAAEPPLRCWKISVADNALSRSLSLLEQARAAAGLMEVCESATRAADIAKPLGLSLNAVLIHKLIRLLALPEGVQRAVGQNRMSLNLALALESVDSADVHVLVQLFENLSPTVSHQQEIFTSLHDLACLREKTIAAVLQHSDLARILSDLNLDRRQKLQALRKALYKQRYPALSLAEEKFETRKKQLDLPDNIRLAAPAGFESPVYTLTIHFTSSGQLCESARNLASICCHPDLIALISRDGNANQ